MFRDILAAPFMLFAVSFLFIALGIVRIALFIGGEETAKLVDLLYK